MTYSIQVYIIYMEYLKYMMTKYFLLENTNYHRLHSLLI